jgi:hypothetical protein
MVNTRCESQVLLLDDALAAELAYVAAHSVEGDLTLVWENSEACRPSCSLTPASFDALHRAVEGRECGALISSGGLQSVNVVVVTEYVVAAKVG